MEVISHQTWESSWRGEAQLVIWICKKNLCICYHVMQGSQARGLHAVGSRGLCMRPNTNLQLCLGGCSVWHCTCCAPPLRFHLHPSPSNTVTSCLLSQHCTHTAHSQNPIICLTFSAHQLSALIHTLQIWIGGTIAASVWVWFILNGTWNCAIFPHDRIMWQSQQNTSHKACHPKKSRSNCAWWNLPWLTPRLRCH